MRLQIALLSIFLTSLLAGSVVSPMLYDLAELFGDPNLAKTYLTLPSLIIIPFLFLSGTLESFFSKRKLIIVGLYSYLFIGLASVFINDAYILLILRGLTGVAAGFIIPYSASLVAEYFTVQQRDRILGYSGVMVYGSGIFLLLLSGFLIHIYWKLGFLVNMVAIIPLILITMFVPEVVSQYNVRDVPYILKISFKKVVYQVALAYFGASTLLFTYFINISFLIEEASLGGARESSVAQSFFMLAGVVSNLLINVIRYRAPRLLIHSLQMIFVSFGFITLSLYSSTSWLIYLGSFLIGIGYGSFGQSLIGLVADNTSRLNRVNALAFVTSAMFIGQFLSPYLTNNAMRILYIPSYRFLFFLEGLIFLLVSLILFTIFWRETKIQPVKY